MEKHLYNNRTQQGPGYDLVGSIATNVADGFTMVAVGDLIVSRAVTKSQDTGFADVVKILRNADVTFGNLEVNVFDIRSFSGYPQAEYGGAYHLSLPEVGPDLRAMGFNMVGRANNHTLDWGIEGMRETSSVLDASDMVYAGTGENLAQAGAARFLETARGRVALVSFAATFAPMARAGDPAGEAPGRPGLNALRLAKSIVVQPEMLENLRLISAALPTDSAAPQVPNKVLLAGTTYKAGDEVGYSFEPDARDVADILRNVRRGKQFSDFCIVTNHGHEPGNWSDESPDYERCFAHSLIDAGADAYIGHGPHQLRGIEIFKGRPIFYSLGNFFQDDLGTPAGADMYGDYTKDPRVHTDAEVKVAEMASYSDPVFWQSIVALSRFEQNQLAELRLYPVELGSSKRFANRGIPQLANREEAKAILERLLKLSEPFGTEIAIENDVGVIRVRPTSLG
ncbi:MAG: CapA family protein [Mesorhizobium sp.]|uniref:CapA family protein n=1 Tax=unclassified Mesorhizobium TaxID=325217 RepID=UPI000F758DF3|nr:MULTISPECIES: CapA family protein [unclassified Mesorhizobium]AZO63204.1 CapA family protein [Mesorhizobium sp. M1A.F.Ca.IN.022.06.1.1]RWG39401.1 MAG: CapA family protein [Mesorhizobium sp.]